MVIPTFKYHLELLKETLHSIAAQTRLPDLVIARASSCDSECELTLSKIRATPWPFPLEILATPELQFTGQNKNEGAAAVPKDIDIISFFDSDDLMHPRRLEFVERCILEGADVVSHAYKCCDNRKELPEWPLKEEIATVSDSFIKRETIRSPYLNTTIDIRRLIFLDDNNDEVGYHDGSLTMRRECFSQIKFQQEAKGHQDCEFYSDLHGAGYRVLTIRNELMIYMTASDEERVKKNAAHLYPIP